MALNKNQSIKRRSGDAERKRETVPCFDQVEGLDDAGGEHAAEATEQELHTLPRLTLSRGHLCCVVFASWNLASNCSLFCCSYTPGIPRMPHACARTGRGETRRTQGKKERGALLYVVMYMNQKYIVCTWSTVRIDEVKCSRCCGHETQDVPGTVLGLAQRLTRPQRTQG